MIGNIMDQTFKYLCVTILALAFFSPTLAQSNAANCSVAGKCLDSQYIKHLVTEDEPKCLVECQETSGCGWYTFNPAGTLCELFKDCVTLTDETCSDCLSGEVTCEPYDCEIPGICQGQLDADSFDLSRDSCLNKCKTNPDCTWYSYDYDLSWCFEFSTCPTITTDVCPGCKAGQEECRNNGIQSWTKILLVGGNITNTAVFDIMNNDLECEGFGEFPPIRDAAAGTIMGIPVVCGGSNFSGNLLDTCYTYNKESGQFEVDGELNLPRGGAAAVVLNDTSLLVTGGLVPGTYSPTTEIRTLYGGSVEGPDMIDGRDDHCIIKINETMLLITGGGGFSPEFYKSSFMDLTTGSSTEGPRFSNRMSNHACGLFEGPQGQQVAVVTGSAYINEHIYTYVMDLSADELIWKHGPDLPEERWVGQMITTPDKQGVFFIGGYGNTDIIELRCNETRAKNFDNNFDWEDDCFWRNHTTSLPTSFFNFNVVQIPDEITNCSLKK